MPEYHATFSLQTPDIQTFTDWEKFLAEPEAGPFSEFEVASASQENPAEEQLSSFDHEQGEWKFNPGYELSPIDFRGGLGK